MKGGPDLLIPKPGPFLRGPGGIWVPGSQRLPDASEHVQVFVPHDVVFPGLPGDFGEFKRLVASLSRTDTLFWCARLNVLVSAEERDAIEAQNRCLLAFLRSDERFVNLESLKLRIHANSCRAFSSSGSVPINAKAAWAWVSR